MTEAGEWFEVSMCKEEMPGQRRKMQSKTVSAASSSL